MKFTEALEKAHKNPGKVFERDSSKMLMRFNHFKLEFKYQGLEEFMSCDVTHHDIVADWNPVLQEATWQEALDAWLEKNKKIKVVVHDDNVNGYIRKEIVITPSNNDLVHFRTYSKYGKWYILED